MPESQPAPAPDVASAERSMRAAQQAWARTPLPERLRVIERLRGLIAADARALAESVDMEGQRDTAETLTAEVIPLADACRFLVRQAPRILAPRQIGLRGRALWLFGTRSEIRREPRGIVLIIAPGNYRLLLAGVQAIQALAAGNAVCLKPAPGGEGTLRRLADCLREAGLPNDLLVLLPADAGERALQGDIDHVVLTGSAATGRRVLADLAPRLVPATLELSGRDAAFVLGNADIALTADCLAWGATFNAGATCIAPRRVFVVRACADALVEALAARLSQKPAMPVNAALHEEVDALLDQAAQQGARIVGTRTSTGGAVMRPLLVCHDDVDSPLLKRDLFVPVISVIPVDDMDQALAYDRCCPYALGASIFGACSDARTLAARVNAGVVTINDVIAPTADARLPFSGRGDSGYGSTRGAEGLLEMTQPKAVIVRSGRLRPHTQARRPSDSALFEAFIQFTHGARWRDRIKALARMISAGRRRAGERPYKRSD